MVKMRIQKGDKVMVIAGKDKGKQGKILSVDKKENKVLVEGVNKVKRHVKPGKVSKEGGIITMEKPIDASNVMYLDEKTGKPVRLGSRIIDGKDYRINKRTGDVLES
jgi:large subunit ribosomal protein L24